MRQKARAHWVPWLLSTGVHTMLLVLYIGISRKTAGLPDQPASASDPARQVDMIYVPPPPPAPVVRRVRPPQPSTSLPTPPPPVTQRQPEPEPNAPPEARRTLGNESDQPLPAKAPVTQSAPPAAPREDISELVSEARRIFGRPRRETPAGAGPQAIRPMEAYRPDDPERCIPHPVSPGAPGTAPQLGTVVGRIFRKDTGLPLAGAQLQMLGAPYVAFTDGRGEYRFRFDLALVDNCRTQYVRVSAPGYETRLLVLGFGPNAWSEDVLLRPR